MHRSVAVILVSCVLAPITAARAEVTVPDPGTYVVDRAGVFDAATRQKLEGWLVDLQRKTSAQVKILTVTTTEGEPFFDFVQRHAELWKLGQKGKDNGVLIAVAIKDRKYRVQVGYGLEGVLTDQWCGSLGRKVFVPSFRQSDYAQGLYRGAIAVANKIADDANVKLTGLPRLRQRVDSPGPKGLACGGVVPIVILLILLSSLSRRNRYRGRWGGGGLLQALFWGSVLSGGLRGGGRSSWGGGFGGGFGGGGFGGGGFGGGSFGGGGGFGGGGAGGSW